MLCEQFRNTASSVDVAGADRSTRAEMTKHLLSCRNCHDWLYSEETTAASVEKQGRSTPETGEGVDAIVDAIADADGADPEFHSVAFGERR